MLKRNIAILIAGGLLGGQVNLATAGDSTFTSNDVEVYSKMLPAQAEYFKQREASRTQGVVSGNSFPPSADNMYWTMLPAQNAYFAQRARDTQTAACGDSFPPSADEMYWKMLPAQVAYFERRAPTQLAMAPGTCPLRKGG